MYVLLILITGLFIKYSESCQCYECEVSNTATTWNYEHQGACSNDLSGTDDSSCMITDCTVEITLLFNIKDIHRTLSLNNSINSKYTIIRGCVSGKTHGLCQKAYGSNSDERIVNCQRVYGDSHGNDISLTNIVEENVASIYELCVVCKSKYSISDGCNNDKESKRICISGLCYITIGINNNNFTTIIKGCLLNYYNETLVIKRQKFITEINRVYPYIGKDIELWATCNAALDSICNSHKFIFRNIDKSIIERSVKIYKNKSSWNHCLYCYTTASNSLCAKGTNEIGKMHHSANVIICYGKCIVTFVIKSSARYGIARYCNKKRDGKIGGLKKEIEKLSKQKIKNGCNKNTTIVCKTECSDEEQSKQYCNRWPITLEGNFKLLKRLFNVRRNMLESKKSRTNKIVVKPDISQKEVEEWVTNVTDIVNTTQSSEKNDMSEINDFFYQYNNIEYEIQDYDISKAKLIFRAGHKNHIGKHKREYLYYTVPILSLIIALSLSYFAKKYKSFNEQCYKDNTNIGDISSKYTDITETCNKTTKQVTKK